MSLTNTAVNRPVTITVICIAAIMLGFYSFHKLSIDFLPDIDVPKLIVQAECPGANTRDVEENVTRVIEANLSTLQDVHKIYSISRDGIAFIHVTFNWGTDMDFAFIKVRSKLDRMQENLPEYAERPTVLRFDPSSTPIMSFVVTGDRIEHPKSARDYQNALVELKEVAASIIKRRLEQIDGIAFVLVEGGLEREIQIFLDEKKCTAFKIGFAEIESALRKFNVTASGGTIRDGYFEFPLRILAEYQRVDEIYATPVKHTESGETITLREIARIEDGFKERTGFTRLNGKEVISLFLFKEAGANTVEASRSVYHTLSRLFEEYPEFRVLPVYDQAEFIQDAINNVLQSLYLGGIFAFFILFYFLRDLKSPVIIGISIPISIITTVIFMYFFKINFNIISLGGLALGIGMLVDNSIVVLENIYRYKEMGHNLLDAAVKGTREVSLAITASTFTTVSVFLPLIYVRGLAGELFYEQSVTITIALLVSLLVSITVLATLAGRNPNPFAPLQDRWNLRSFQPIPFSTADGWLKKIVFILIGLIENLLYAIIFGIYRLLLRHLIRFIQFTILHFQQFLEKVMTVYEENLERALVHRHKVMLITLLLFLGSVLGFVFIKKELMPPVDQKQLVISAELAPGVSLTATTAAISKLEQDLMRVPGVKNVLASIGITENVLDQTYQPGVNKAILDLEIQEKANSFAVAQQIEHRFGQFPEMTLAIQQRATIFEQLFQQQPDLFDVRLAGPELAELNRLNLQILGFLQQQSGFENAISSLRPGGQEFALKLNRERMVQYNITLNEISDFLQKQLQGSVPTQFIDFSDKIDIKVMNQHQRRLTLRQIEQLQYPATRTNGQTIFIPLEQVLTIEPGTGFSEITRENQTRIVNLTASLNEISFSDAQSQLEEYLTTIDIPGGYLVETGIQQQEMLENYRNLLLIFIISLALVYFILSAQFESVKLPLIILLAIPLSFIGIILTLYLTGNSLNMMSLIGIVILVGIVVNDSIVKVDFIHRQHQSGSELKTALLAAGQKRFRPILMTTITTVCGLLPMALAMGSGAEMRRPLAWVIIGGISVATLLTLIVIPVIYSVIVREKA